MSVTRTEDQERLRRQRTRSVAIGLGLGALVILFYVVTIVKLGPNALRKDNFSGQPRPGAAVSVPVGAAGGPGSPGSAGGPEAACRKAGTC
jgi:hypothetical protein